jgi:beta-1,4-mannosyltransferase
MDLHRHGAPVTEHVVVLQSFPDPRPTTNPYIVMLGESLRAEPGVTMLTFSWKRALLSHYDVFHVHWPEILVAGHSRLKTLGRQVLCALLILRLTVTRTPVVRTVHNLDRPAGLSSFPSFLLDRLERLTAMRVVLNESTPLPPGHAAATILHGHYADWFAQHPTPRTEAGRFGFVGLIRPYKGVDRLVDCFRALDDPSLRLDVAGKPGDDALAADLVARRGDDDRIRFTFEYLSDADLVDHVGRAELIVLPYTDARNSGGALTALSLARPVLVPDNVLNRTLQEEFGDRWVHVYDGELTPAAMLTALAAVRAQVVGTGGPDLSARSWSDAGRAHLEAYRRALVG